MNKIASIGLALAIVVGLMSCKPKQSAYKSVYEAAKEKEMAENKNTEPVSKPAYSGYDPNASSDEPLRTEKLKPVYSTDASNLKRYSVVIASLGVKPNAEILKKKMEDEGHSIILAQNETGLFRVIIGSYDDKAQAGAKRREIKAEFSDKGDSEYLKKYIIFHSMIYGY